MASDLYTREQRLRKQAELQSFQVNLVTLRKQESSYIAAQAHVPELLSHQIQWARREIRKVEQELLALRPPHEAQAIPGREFYWEGFDAELTNDFEHALKTYRNAAYHNYPDAEAATQSLRHAMKMLKAKPIEARPRTPYVVSSSQRHYFTVGVIVLALLFLTTLSYNQLFSSEQDDPKVAAVPTPTLTFTPVTVIQIIPDTATPLPTKFPTETPTETATPISFNSNVLEITEPASTNTPTTAPTLRPAPRIIGPKDGLTWGDGAIVFEFEPYPNLADDELYCVQGMKGFDRTYTENWSYPATSSLEPSIPIEANVFRVARDQKIQCIIWEAAIGKNTCNNLVSNPTDTRIIILSGPCVHDKLKF